MNPSSGPAFQAVLTTIRPPTPAVRELHRRVAEAGGRLVVAGDRKGPAAFDLPGCDFLDLPAQRDSGFTLAARLPEGHYARKNVGYLHAIRSGARVIYETDDDNAPLAAWRVRDESVAGARRVAGADPAAGSWINVYRCFTDDPRIWPRGFPLERLADAPAPAGSPAPGPVRAPVQQGLVNGSPDVDAAWRLTQDRPFTFEDRAPVRLGPGQWCPFNTQSTWWWPAAYPLLYVPSHCSFRMCDIWKSFVAQRCLWALGAGVVFHPPEVFQDRNPHDYLKDFEAEVPGYLNNARIARVLEALELDPAPSAVGENLRACYRALVGEAILPADELPLVGAWLADLARTGSVAP